MQYTEQSENESQPVKSFYNFTNSFVQIISIKASSSISTIIIIIIRTVFMCHSHVVFK